MCNIRGPIDSSSFDFLKKKEIIIASARHFINANNMMLTVAALWSSQTNSQLSRMNNRRR
jgi:hypothetical protein